MQTIYSSAASDFVPGPDWLEYGIVGLCAVVALAIVWKVPTDKPMGIIAVVGGAVALTALTVVLQAGNDRQSDDEVERLEDKVDACAADLRAVRELLVIKGRGATDLRTAKGISRQAVRLVNQSDCG